MGIKYKRRPSASASYKPKQVGNLMLETKSVFKKEPVPVRLIPNTYQDNTQYTDHRGRRFIWFRNSWWSLPKFHAKMDKLEGIEVVDYG